MITRERLKDLIAKARETVDEREQRLKVLQRDENIGSSVLWSALVDYSCAVEHYTTLVDVLTDKENDDT